MQKPGRYTGGELNQVVKDWSVTPVRLALAFPDLYELGMSNLGLAILYDLVNQREDMLAERVFTPWPDMQAALRDAGIPLYSLESKRPLTDFDVLGISLPYESLYTNVLSLLDLANIPLASAERTAQDPLVLAGGHACHNPEPMAAFIDAFVIGEGEEVLLEIMEAVRRAKTNGATRESILLSLADLQGVYVPSFYQASYHSDGTLARFEPTNPSAKPRIGKRIVPKLPPPPTRLIVPFLDVTHDRIPMEIMRGCTRGCRFCQAGMITRPVRERPVEEIIEAIQAARKHTGFENIGLLSLSSSDYSHIEALVESVKTHFGDERIDVSLPSLRIETFSAELMEKLKGLSRHSGFTLAPEAASERMREIINKPVSTEQVLDTARAIFERGWENIKLYFMIGHPEETLKDVEQIADLCHQVLAVGRSIVGKRARVTASASTFVPKPHTPFQWVPMDSSEQILAKQKLLKDKLRGRGLKLSWSESQSTFLEARLARGDRRMGAVIAAAWRRGARFDAWQEHFSAQIWQQAFEQAGLDPDFYSHRNREPDELLPWDHINAGVRRKILEEEYQRSLEGRVRPDCRTQCYACGILPEFSDLRRAHPGASWCCPEVGRQTAQPAASRQPQTTA